MTDYLKFWLAKELIPLIFIGVLFGGVGLFVAACYVIGTVQNWLRRMNGGQK